MEENKVALLKKEIDLLQSAVQNEAKNKWGKMNAQQMLEHVATFFDVATEKETFPLVTPEEQLPQYLAFIYSDKQFRENTKAPEAILGEETLPLRFATFAEAKMELQQSADDFFSFFQKNPGKKTVHPVFGPLSFDEWVLLHTKHVMHHLNQFHNR